VMVVVTVMAVALHLNEILWEDGRRVKCFACGGKGDGRRMGSCEHERYGRRERR